jgi:hypothetical protein
MIAGGSGAMSLAHELGTSEIQVGGSLAAWADELQRQSVA